MLRGDFGEIFFYKKQVAELIGERLEPTLSLSLADDLSRRADRRAARRASPRTITARWIDRCVMGFSVLGFSVPVFVVGYMLIYIFAVTLDWLPVQGYQRHQRRGRRLVLDG